MKKITILAICLLAIAAIAGGLLNNKKPKNIATTTEQTATNSDIVSKEGIHRHPNLAIYIKGRKQEIPANIGIGKRYANSKWYDPMMSMTDFHTHDTSGELHWEVMEGPVTKKHIQLKAFFEVWGKTFNSNQIFDAKNGSDEMVKMTVNGQPNSEFENYQVKDKDQIEIRYE